MPFKEPAHKPGQLWLLPPSLEELVPEGADVRLFSEALDAMDWSQLEGGYSATGRPAYPPQILAKILVYAYSRGIRSSRQIAELVRNDVRFMWLAQMERPDFHTIARFRKEHFEDLCQLFVESVRICERAGLVSLLGLSVDGTKIRANASRKSVWDAKRIKAEMERIRQLLREADEEDCREDAQFGERELDELPEQLRDPEIRRIFLQELAREMEREGSRHHCTTDPESAMMKTREGVRPSYNVQTAVDVDSQVALGWDVIDKADDHGQLLPLIDQVENNTGFSPGTVLADAGYSDEQTLRGLDERGQDALLNSVDAPRQRGGDPEFAAEKFVYEEGRDCYLCPAGRELHINGEYRCGSGCYRMYRATGCQTCPFYRRCVPSGRKSRQVSVSVIAHLRKAMRQRLSSPEGRKLYSRRMSTIEPVFGHLKHNLGFRRFLLRGLNGAKAETALILTAYNLRKWVKMALLALSGLRNLLSVSLPSLYVAAFFPGGPFTSGAYLSRRSCETASKLPKKRTEGGIP